MTADGSSGFKAESGRYHLYVSYAGTVHMDRIKQHYYRSHRTINPNGIVPLGPEIDFTEPHGRTDKDGT